MASRGVNKVIILGRVGQDRKFDTHHQEQRSLT